MPDSQPEIPPAHELHRLVHDLLERLDQGEPIDIAALSNSYRLPPDQWEAIRPTLETLQAFGLFAGRSGIDAQRTRPHSDMEIAAAQPLESGPIEERPFDGSSQTSGLAEKWPPDGRPGDQAQHDIGADATHQLHRRLDAGTYDQLLRDLWRARQRFRTGPQD